MGRLPDLRTLNVLVVTPAPASSRAGNRTSALRWAGLLRGLGHRVRLASAWEGEACDVLVALHATRSHASIARFRAARPGAPLVVVLGGTDLYQDLPASEEARRSLALASRLVVLQPLGLRALPAEVRAKARAIIQSATARPPLPAPPGVLRACLLSHVRMVKGNFLAAEAVRLLPPRSRIAVVHLGAALDPGAAEEARRLSLELPRYHWWGDRRRAEALGALAGSALLLVTSRLEGGANAVSEALAANVPVLSTRVDGSVGVLGEDYAGYYPVGDAPALAALLLRFEEEAAFAGALRQQVARARPLVEPAREREAWRALLAELVPQG